MTFDAKRGDWVITWPVKGSEPRKERVDGSRIDAERVLRQRLAERDAGTYASDHRMTLDQWLTVWLGSHVAAKSTGTIRRYTDLTDRLIRPAIGHVKLADLDPEILARFKADLIRKGHTPRGADSVLDVLGAALTVACKSPKPPIRVNPRNGVKRELKRKAMIDPPTRAEADAILAAPLPPKRRAAFALAIGHGLRESEVLGLRRGDRTADGLSLHVVAKANPDGTIDSEPKDGSTRIVRLKPWVAATLDELGPGPADSLLFPSSRDPRKAMHGHTLLDWVHEISAELGLRRRYTFHDLRRAFGTRNAAGNDLNTLARAMGHRDTRTTLLYVAAGELVDDLDAPAWHAPVSDPESLIVSLRQPHQPRRKRETHPSEVR